MSSCRSSARKRKRLTNRERRVMMGVNMQVLIVVGMTICLASVADSANGTATYYTLPYVPSACYGNESKGVMIAAASHTIWNNQSACGKNYSIKCTELQSQSVPCKDGNIVVMIVDYCPSPGCGSTFDLSEEAFFALAKQDLGKMDIEYNEIVTNFVRIPNNESAPTQEGTNRDSKGSIFKQWWIWCIMAIAPALAIFLLGYFCYKRQKLKLLKRIGQSKTSQDKSLVALKSRIKPFQYFGYTNKLNSSKKNGSELQLFSLHQILSATDNFSSANKLGEGGFGPVYKGILLDGQEVAVKRLARSSGQGLVEFKNEITLIAELQHMNLVRLLGCCIEEEEKLLVYEYMPNGSLDSFLFDSNRRRLLDWKRRFSIIEGIAQGLLYLHKYSRLRVIHRDLKASNILLDDGMNSKISDFGMARIFGRNDSEANTNRVVGTYGYMSPEYAMNGIFSVKSDVYSFGVLLLEIVSGRKNTSFSHSSGPLTLIEHAWNLWKQQRTFELVDTSLDSSCLESELLRCIHVGLLCVQECATDRPTMSDVISMLTNETTYLPDPKQPAFCIRENQTGEASADGKLNNPSLNVMSISVMKAR